MFKSLILTVTICFGLVVGDVREILVNQNRILSPFGIQPTLNSGAALKIVPIPAGAGNQIVILRQEQNIDPDGSYKWAYETANGIAAQEEGALRVQAGPDPSNSAQGSYSYTSPEGEQIAVSYLADENGFQPQGAHLPTPPPIPESILRALAWIEAHPEKENANKL